MPDFFARTHFFCKNQTILTNATYPTGGLWTAPVNFAMGLGFQFFTMFTSSGAATLTLKARISPCVAYPGKSVFPTDQMNPISFYEEKTIITASTTQTGLWHVDIEEMQHPFVSAQFQVTIGVADATAVYVGICRSVAP